MSLNKFNKESCLRKFAGDWSIIPTCQKTVFKNKIYLENIHDVADCVMKIIAISGINIQSVKPVLDIIVCAFLNHDEVLQGIDRKPHKRLCKDDFIHELGRQAALTRPEGNFTYAVTRRAFKAFYYGFDDKNGHSDIDGTVMLSISQESMWVYAAQRTAEIYTSFSDIFRDNKETVEQQFKYIYIDLHRRMQSRICEMDWQYCECEDCEKNDFIKPMGMISAVSDTLTYVNLPVNDDLPMTKECYDLMIEPPTPSATPNECSNETAFLTIPEGSNSKTNCEEENDKKEICLQSVTKLSLVELSGNLSKQDQDEKDNINLDKPRKMPYEIHHSKGRFAVCWLPKEEKKRYEITKHTPCLMVCDEADIADKQECICCCATDQCNYETKCSEHTLKSNDKIEDTNLIDMSSDVMEVKIESVEKVIIQTIYKSPSMPIEKTKSECDPITEITETPPIAQSMRSIFKRCGPSASSMSANGIVFMDSKDMISENSGTFEKDKQLAENTSMTTKPINESVGDVKRSSVDDEKNASKSSNIKLISSLEAMHKETEEIMKIVAGFNQI